MLKRAYGPHIVLGFLLGMGPVFGHVHNVVPVWVSSGFLITGPSRSSHIGGSGMLLGSAFDGGAVHPTMSGALLMKEYLELQKSPKSWPNIPK